MTDILEAFKPLAEAYNKQFNLELSADDLGTGKISVTDGANNAGVARVGSVKSNWLKRNAPKFGFVRTGDGVTFAWVAASATPVTENPIKAEEAEVAAVTTVTDVLPDVESIPLELDDARLSAASFEIDDEAVEEGS